MSIQEQGSDAGTGEAAAHVVLAVSGETAAGAFRCAECGYGVTVRRVLPLCPMCGGTAWQHSSWRPFTRGRGRPVL